jgi:hypothetical protein
MSDIESFIRTLLADDPRPPKSLQLEIDTDGDAAGLFEALLTIFITILKRWYLPPINLSTVSENDMERLDKYFRSFGIRLHVDSEPEPRVVRIDNKAYENKQDLRDMTFQMTSGGKLYTVHFSFC